MDKEIEEWTTNEGLSKQIARLGMDEERDYICHFREVIGKLCFEMRAIFDWLDLDVEICFNKVVSPPFK